MSNFYVKAYLSKEVVPLSCEGEGLGEGSF